MPENDLASEMLVPRRPCMGSKLQVQLLESARPVQKS